MKKTTIALFTLSICSACLFGSFASATSKLKMINSTGEPIYVFIRGKGTSRHYVKILGKNHTAFHNVEPESIENKPIFEVIVATTNGDPNWKLLGGNCSDLQADRDHTLLIEKTLQGLKTSCTELKGE